MLKESIKAGIMRVFISISNILLLSKISYRKVYSNTLFYDKVQLMGLHEHSKVNKIRWCNFE